MIHSPFPSKYLHSTQADPYSLSIVSDKDRILTFWETHHKLIFPDPLYLAEKLWYDYDNREMRGRPD